MAKQQITPVLPASSLLERFTLEFEYNKSIQDVKHDMRLRTLKNSR